MLKKCSTEIWLVHFTNIHLMNATQSIFVSLSPTSFNLVELFNPESQSSCDESKELCCAARLLETGMIKPKDRSGLHRCLLDFLYETFETVKDIKIRLVREMALLK